MSDVKIGVLGLGYVGLPLFLEFAKYYDTVGFDTNITRIEELRSGIDRTNESTEADLKGISDSSGSLFTSNIEELESCNFYVVTVPTPIDKFKRPDLSPLISASTIIGGVLKREDIVVYESTVYPGATEEDCVPVLERVSGLVFNKDFFCGYSPERINPGDKVNTITSIKKVTSGSTAEVALKVDGIYASIITAGTHLAPSIKVAEAAKVIENAQRDINISFVNELSVIFNKMGIRTQDVLDAASTKWNFLKFQPGLVGGHCIGVDPYYLTHKAEELGYKPEVIHAGRRLNDNMAAYVANQIVKLMIRKGHRVSRNKVLVLGITFKENCPDVRNSKVVDLINELVDFGCDITVCDPCADASVVRNEFGLELTEYNPAMSSDDYAAIVLAVPHRQFISEPFLSDPEQVVYDIKGVLPHSDGAL